MFILLMQIAVIVLSMGGTLLLLPANTEGKSDFISAFISFGLAVYIQFILIPEATACG